MTTKLPLKTEVKGDTQRIPSNYHQAHLTSFSIVTVLAFLTRFIGLAHPSETVYDEAHIIRFVSWYLKRSFFFDVHPPFGKLLYLAIAWLFGYDGNLITYDVGVSFVDARVPYLALRSLPALLSALTVSIVYLITWESGYGVPACVVAAGLVLFDNAQIAQTRLIYLDAILCFAIVCSLYCYIRFSKSQQQPFSRPWWMWLLLTGFALSCSISTKYVGLFTYLTIGTYVVADLWRLLSPKAGQGVSPLGFAKHFGARYLCLLLIPFVLYLTWFKIHFTILTRPGQGLTYMSKEFARALLQNARAKRTVVRPPFFQSWLELQNVMLFDNSLISDPHPYDSRPEQWPFLSGGIGFWCSDAERQQIFFLGNVPGYLIAAISLFIFENVVVMDLLSSIRGLKCFSHDTRSRLYNSGLLFFLAWAFHYVPFFFMNRQLMLHNYLPAHLASALVVGSLIDLLDTERASKTNKARSTASGNTAIDEKSVPSGATSMTSANRTVTDAELNRGTWIVSAAILLATSAWWLFWLPVTYGYPGLSMNGIRWRDPYDLWLQYAWE